MSTNTRNASPTLALSTPARPRTWFRRPLFLVPGIAFLLLAALLADGLTRDPRLLPSPLIGKPVPAFELAPVRGRLLGLASSDLQGEVSLVNVFASWCVACRQEHPLLMTLARDAVVPIHGLNYKDAPEDASAWLDALGDPYTRTGADIDGRVAIDWGVYGVPETFVIDADGRIAYKHVGPVSPQFVQSTLLPLVRKLQADARTSTGSSSSGTQR